MADNTFFSLIEGLPAGGASGPAGGDLSGTYPNPSVVALDGIPIADTPTTGEVLSYDGTNLVYSAAGGPPSGAAGGDLTGTYPNPTLGVSGVTAATYPSIGSIPQIAIDAKGRVTSASSVTNGSALTTLNASNLSSGTVAIARIPTGTSSSTVTIGNDSRLPPTPTGAGKLLYDNGTAYVENTAGTSSQVLIGGTAPAFGNVPAAAIPATTVTAAAYPTAGSIPTFTVGADGRLTAAGSATSGANLTSLNATNLSTGTVAKARGGFGVDVSTGLTNNQVALVSSNAINIGALPLAALPISTMADLQVFSTPGTTTWTKPTAGNLVFIMLIGGGGGGGSGRRGSSASGGGGGAGGGVTFFILPKSSLGGSETVVVGAGGAGGAAQTVDSTNGNNGVAGADTIFRFSGTNWLFAKGGGQAGGGTTTDGVAGAPPTISMFNPNTPGTGSTGAGGATGFTASLAPGSGAGGGGWNGTTASAGGGSYAPGVSNISFVSGGAAPGGNGSTPVFSTPVNYLGLGGTGGAGSGTTNGGTGGTGGTYGAGGGGGGGCANTFNSGAGGAGANGIALVYTF